MRMSQKEWGSIGRTTHTLHPHVARTGNVPVDGQVHGPRLLEQPLEVAHV